jgi:hypothetical protein
MSHKRGHDKRAGDKQTVHLMRHFPESFDFRDAWMWALTHAMSGYYWRRFREIGTRNMRMVIKCAR